MKNIKVSAPGKLMLFGEHVVVYDYPCVVTAVSSRIYVEVEKTSERFIINAPQVRDTRFVKEAIIFFRDKYKIGNGLSIKTSSDFSSKFGLGSSSAVTVATIYALSKLYQIEISQQEIFDLGYKVTLSVQGVGSGFDIAAAVFGGTLYFVTSGKIIKPLSVKELSLVIGYSGVKADTSMIVNSLRSKACLPVGRSKITSQKSKTFKIFNDIKQIVEEAKDSLINSNWKRVGKLMNDNHKYLQDLGVSTEKLDKMCHAAVVAGAYGAKLSGAGGGDCMIALTPQEKIKKVELAIVEAGGEIINVKNNSQGVKLEKI